MLLVPKFGIRRRNSEFAEVSQSSIIHFSSRHRRRVFQRSVPLSFQSPASAVGRKYTMFTPSLNEEYIVVEDVTAR